MKKILDFIANETYGKNYKSYKYCFEAVDIPKIEYEDKKGIQVKRSGETDKSLKKPKNLKEKADWFARNEEPLFKFFLDGSRRTYKVDDIAYDKKLYPIIAGQIGVAICEREDAHTFRASSFRNPLVMAVPDKANAETTMHREQLFYNNLLSKLNEQTILKSQNLTIDQLVSYSCSQLDQNTKYEDRGVAKIQNLMINLEQKVVNELVRDKKLKDNAFLLKDGSLEYAKTNDSKELSKIKSNYDRVVGVSKMFSPEALSKDVKDISRQIAELEVYERTPAFMYETERIQNVKFAVWYVKIRKTSSPFDGILKLEKVLVREKQEREGLDSDEIDNITANIINERNPVCYGQDNRWAKHLYPVYLTEKYIKSKYLSDTHFVNLF